MKPELRNTKQYLMIHRKWSFIILITLLFFVSCSQEDDYPQYNPPSDHTINKDGVMHKSGLSDPTLNCTACHGADLTGGTSQVSCYGCHGVEW